MSKTTLDEFGATLVAEVRDQAIVWLGKWESGTVRAEPDIRLHREIGSLSPEARKVGMHLARRLIDETIHNFLWMIEQSDRVASDTDGRLISRRRVTGSRSSRTDGSRDPVASATWSSS